MSVALAAARQGDRHSHAAGKSSRDAGALLSVLTGALSAAVGEGGVATAVIGAGVASGGGGGRVSTMDVIPYAVSGAVAAGSPRTRLGASGLGVALAMAEPLDCHNHRDGPIRTGSATVTIDGFRVARVTDQIKCGAELCDGEKTVLVGGPPADGAPPDPLAVIAGGAATLGAAIGDALGAGTAAVEMASRWAESIGNKALAAVDGFAASAEEAAGTVSAKAGALVSEISGALLGVLAGTGFKG